MKIAFVGQPFDYFAPPVQAHSLAIWTYQVALRLAERHQVAIYGRKGTAQKADETVAGIRYRRIPVALDDNLQRVLKLPERLLGYPFPTKPYYANQLYYRAYIANTAQMMAADGVEAIHLFNFSQHIPPLRAANPKAVIAINMQCEWLSQLDRAMIDGRLAGADLLLGCSEYITQKIAERFPHYAARCQTVYNGVDETYLDYQPGNLLNGRHGNSMGKQADSATKELLFVGRLSPEKGIHILLEALAKVVRLFPHVHLNIVGPPGDLPYDFIVMVSDDEKVKRLTRFYQGRWRSGTYYPELQRLAAPLAEHVTFTGAIPHSEVIRYYQKADILINPSFSESFGMSLVEAMASGVPVVATRVGGMQHIVQEGINGLLVEAGDVDALAEAILAMLQDDGGRNALAQAGRARVEGRYTWRSIAQRLESLLGQAAAQPKAELAYA